VTVTEQAGPDAPPPEAPRSGGWARNAVLVLTILLLVAAVGLGVFAWSVRSDTEDLEATTARRVTRTEQIEAQESTAERDLDVLRERAAAVDAALRALLGALQDQLAASNAAVAAANDAAARYSGGEAPLPDAFNAIGAAPLAELERINGTVQSALTTFRLALEELRGDG
jgi:uncharacterized protein HemX